jgi:type III secretory pathway component EscV
VKRMPSALAQSAPCALRISWITTTSGDSISMATAAMSGWPAPRTFQVMTVQERAVLAIPSVLPVRSLTVTSAVIVTGCPDLKESAV